MKQAVSYITVTLLVSVVLSIVPLAAALVQIERKENRVRKLEVFKALTCSTATQDLYKYKPFLKLCKEYK